MDNMERHETHALSSHTLSSDNHSYDFGNKNKKGQTININNNENDFKDERSNYIQIKKINAILSKYNINSEQSQKSNKLNKNNLNTENKKEEEIKINPKLFDNTICTTTSKNKTLDNKRKADKKKSNKSRKSIKTKKEVEIILNKEEVKKEEQKNEEYKNEEQKNDNEHKKEEQKNEDSQYQELHKGKIKTFDGLKFSVTYKDFKRETRFNNIDNFLRQENKNRLLMKKNENSNNNKLLIYKSVNKGGNLIREIKKPPIAFITKIFKNDINKSTHQNGSPKIRLSIINNFCFMTKQPLQNKEYNKTIKIAKYLRNQEDFKDEKIPSFSSINTSSSNDLGNSKSKSKSKKKKISKNKTKPKSKPKNTPKKGKGSLYSKNSKIQKSISLYSKNTKDKSEEGAFKNLKKKKKVIPNIKKKQTMNSAKLIKGVNQDIRKISSVKRYQGKIINLKKEIGKINENEKNNNINANINDNNNNNINEKDKNNTNEINFKKFLEEQRIKRNKQLKNYMKRQGMNSYNFCYPIEPSPLLGLFKKKYNLYPTLNIERKNSVDIGINNDIIIKNKHFYKIRFKPKKMKSFNEKNEIENAKKNIENQNIKLSNHNNNNCIHLIDKHYGIEKDCPLCRAFQMKKLTHGRNNFNYFKSMNYKKYTINSLGLRAQTPSTFNYISVNDNYSNISMNRISSARRTDYIDQYSQIRQNFDILFDYFKQ